MSTTNTARVMAATAFIERATAAHLIEPSDVATWRALYELAPDRAEARLRGRASDPHHRDRAARQILAANGVDYDEAARFAEAFGAENARTAIARYAAGVDLAQGMADDVISARAEQRSRDVLEAHHVPYDEAVRYARIFGCDTPRRAIAKYAAGIEGVE